MTRRSVRGARTRRAAGAAVAAVLLPLTLPAGTAQAARGAENGLISFGRFDPAVGVTSLWVADPDGGRQLQLADEASFSDWSPDGSRLAFDFPGGDDVHIATISPDGSDREQLTDQPGIQESPKWSPDGQWITYGSFDPDQHDEFSTSIWVMRADGSDARQVTTDGFDVEPVFSPDGTRIAFGRLVEISEDSFLEAVYVVNVDGSGLREVVPARAKLEHPDWSPDGRWITFSITPGAPDGGSVLAVRPDGRALHVLRAATERYNFFKPVWSPDGRELLLGCFDKEIRRAFLCTSTRGGGRVRVLDLGGSSGVNFPAWGSHQG